MAALPYVHHDTPTSPVRSKLTSLPSSPKSPLRGYRDPLSPNHPAPWSASSFNADRALPDPPEDHMTSPRIAGSSSHGVIADYQQAGWKEPQVFGAPPPGLVQSDGQANGNRDAGPYLRVRIGGVERNRKDMLIRFDASTNIPGFRTTLYKNMQRTYVEFQRFAEQSRLTSPQTIVPALPLASTSAMTDEEDDRLVRIALQRWFSRVTEDPVLLADDELRNFIESDFGYSPVPPPSAKRTTSATSAMPSAFTAALSKVVRRGPLDEDDDLAAAKGALERLEERWGGAASAMNHLGKARRAYAIASQEAGAKFVGLSTVESDMNLSLAERKVGRSVEQLAGMGGAQAASENVVISDTLGYQALNARAAKDALLQRTQLLEDSQTASKSAITKRRNLERMKGSSNINPMKVDDAIAELDEATALEDSLAKRLNAISTNLHAALRSHSRQTHDDVALALLENARLTVGFHRHILRELESMRPDIARIGGPVVQSSAPINNTPSIQRTPMPPIASSSSQPSMNPSRPYQPPPSHTVDTSQSMFLPGPSQRTPEVTRPASSGLPQAPTPTADPLGGHMAQSMVLPGHSAQRPGTVGRNQGKRLDERQAAKMLAGGF